jgi:DNA mismatch endonuclease (patch repair protein)
MGKSRTSRSGWVPTTDPLRSKIMRSNRGSGNLTTELRLIRLMRMENVIGWRRGVALVGRPDFAFRKARLAVFVDGCFWHGCRCKRMPKLNRPFWKSKIDRNRLRDKEVNRTLRRSGWRVLRIWEHQLKNSPNAVMGRLKEVLGI